MLLHHRQYSGDGEPLLILHGLFGNQGNWGWHARRLADRYAVYGLDLRNHGASPHDANMSYPTMAADVIEWLDAQGMESCHLLGHSMGGKVAMQLAFSEPERVGKLLVADIAPVDYNVSATKSRHPALDAMLRLPVQEMKSRAEADEYLRAAVPEDQVRTFLLTNLDRLPQGFRWRLNLPAIEANLPALSGAPEASQPFGGPALFLFGEQSSYLHFNHQLEIRRLFPAAEIQLLKDAGHWLNVEQPQASLEAIERFLAKNGQGA